MAMIPIDDGNGNIEYVDLVITEDNILLPLNTRIIQGGNEDLLPPTRDISEEIDGTNGEYYEETEFEARSFELATVTQEGLTHSEIYNLKRDIASILNPLNGTKSLVYLIEPDKKYMVDVNGKIEVTPYPTWFQFNIPLIMHDPFIISTFEKSLIGSGTIKNEGTHKTGLIIEISGPIGFDETVEIIIGDNVLTYTGYLTSDNKVIIDTEKYVAKTLYYNITEGFNNVYPMLNSGEELNVIAPNNVKINWFDKWI